jgi:hypothetical protein
MRRSWLDRHAGWKIPLGCLTLILFLTVFVGGLFTVIFTSFRGSDVYKQAIVKAARDPQVRTLIGDPIRSSWFISGQLSVNGSSG